MLYRGWSSGHSCNKHLCMCDYINASVYYIIGVYHNSKKNIVLSSYINVWLHSAWFSRGSLCLASVIEMRGCSRSSSTAAPRLVFDSMAPRHFTRVEFFVLLCLQHLSYLSFAHFAIIYRSIQGATFPSCPNLHIIETSKYIKYVSYSFSSKAAFRLLDNFSDVLRFPTQSANEPRKNIQTHGSFFSNEAKVTQVGWPWHGRRRLFRQRANVHVPRMSAWTGKSIQKLVL